VAYLATDCTRNLTAGQRLGWILRFPLAHAQDQSLRKQPLAGRGSVAGRLLPDGFLHDSGGAERYSIGWQAT